MGKFETLIFLIFFNYHLQQEQPGLVLHFRKSKSLFHRLNRGYPGCYIIFIPGDARLEADKKKRSASYVHLSLVQ